MACGFFIWDQELLRVVQVRLQSDGVKGSFGGVSLRSRVEFGYALAALARVVCLEDAYTAVYGCSKPLSVHHLSFQQHLSVAKSSSPTDLRPHLSLESSAYAYSLGFSFDTGDLLAKH